MLLQGPNIPVLCGSCSIMAGSSSVDCRCKHTAGLLATVLPCYGYLITPPNTCSGAYSKGCGSVDCRCKHTAGLLATPGCCCRAQIFLSFVAPAALWQAVAVWTAGVSTLQASWPPLDAVAGTKYVAFW